MAEKRQGRKHGILKRVAIAIAALLVAGCAAGAAYLGIGHPVDANAMSGENSKHLALDVAEVDNLAVFVEEGTGDFSRGLIFYPGAKVTKEAYGPLASELAARGWFVVVADMPLNMAMLDTNAASAVMERYPQVKSWYVGGHSLGGSAAAMYAAKNADRLAGLVLCAAYSVSDLSATGLEVISVYGSNDTVLNRQRYEENRGHLPNLSELEIAGGNHAQFGCYGEQQGDGPAAISGDEQRIQVADFIDAAAS